MTTNTESTATYLPGLNPRLVTQSLTPNLLCAYCGGVALSTMKDTNNHSFCYECIYKNNCICPIEKTKVEIKKGNDEREIIKNLHVRCENKENGCPWDGLYKAYNNHIHSQCTKVKVHCKHEGCPMEVERESLKLHIASCKFRLFICPDCKNSIKVKAKEKHAKVCPNRMIDCPNNCGAKINKTELQAHLHGCSGTGIQTMIKVSTPPAMTITTEGDIVCPLARLGCNQKHNQAYIDNINAFREGHYQYFEAMVSYFIAEEEKEQKMKKKLEKEKEIEQEKKELEKGKEIEKSTKEVEKAPEIEVEPFKKKKTKDNKENKPHIKDDKVIGKKRAKPLILDEEANLEKTPKSKPQTKDEIICTSKVEQSSINIVIDKEKTELKKEGPSKQSQIGSMIFDITYKLKDIEVQGSIAKFTSLAPLRHKRLFLLTKRDIDITYREPTKSVNVYRWRVFIHNYSKWFAFGLCYKELVKKSNCTFGVKEELPAFLLTTENILDSMNRKENRKKSLLKPFQKKANFILEYFVESQHLAFNYEKESAILNVVRPINPNIILTPCFVFTEAAEVEMEYL